jgi:isopentenyl diphosphate isomerase/L-lactate dehydrogenase-like FMN-dependent dehydrogenase
VTRLQAGGFPVEQVRARARNGTAEIFPPVGSYGHALFGADVDRPAAVDDVLEAARLVPPVFVPQRLEKLIELGREPMYRDVDLETRIGGFRSTLPLYVSAFGSTDVAAGDLAAAVARQAGKLGVPIVVGENVAPMNGFGRMAAAARGSLLSRLSAYVEEVPDAYGGVTIQQSTEDADAEVWNMVYSDLSAQPLLETGRLAFELKVGQGAKPGLGGMTVVNGNRAAAIAEHYAVDMLFGSESGTVLRSSSPGTFTEEILRQQIRLMRNNFPRARIWVKLPPGRDVLEAALLAWHSGADAVTVDGAEGGTGWAPHRFLDHVGLPLAECLRRIGRQSSCLLVSGRMWEGIRIVKCLALGATAAGLGRAALLAAETDPDAGLVRLVRCLELEMRLAISALGKYSPQALDSGDVLLPTAAGEWHRSGVE